MRVMFVTLGCRCNQFETAAMEAALRDRGHEIVTEAPDVAVVNGCAVTAESARKSRQAARRLLKRWPEAKLAVCGCWPQAEPGQAVSAGALLIGGSGGRLSFVEALEALNGDRGGEPVLLLDEALRRREFEELPPARLEGRTRAYLKVEDGCVNFCTYCIIPFLRGPVRSMRPEKAAEEAGRLAAAGVKELTLTGIELASYQYGLADLIEAVAAAAPDLRLRLGSLEPRAVDGEFCRRLAALERLCPHFHLSLQSGCDGTLRRMGRKYDVARFRESLALLRRFFPGCGVSADLITGFPGETEEEFAATLDFLEECRFSHVHVFPYSEREGTKAAHMPDSVPKALREERARQVIERTAAHEEAFLRAQVGQLTEVLFESRMGHTPNYCETELLPGREGEVVAVRVTGLREGRLTVEEAPRSAGKFFLLRVDKRTQCLYNSLNQNSIFAPTVFCELPGAERKADIMGDKRVYNFAAGPSTIPEEVLAEAGAEIMNYRGTGMSIMEMSHRSKAFLSVFEDAKDTLRRILKVPEEFEILFLQGGATLQFAMAPMNLIWRTGKADYAITGSFAGKAMDEAKKYGDIAVAASSKEKNHTYIPAQSELKIREDASYFYYCANNTIYGTEWQYTPETPAGVPLVADMSSDILTRYIDWPKYDLVFAGAQKNMAPAGVTVVFVRKESIGHALPITPIMLDYAAMVKGDSMHNTPPCWTIYMLGLMMKWVEKMGGIEAMEARKRERSKLLYDVIDASSLYKGCAEKDSRSFMNVTFVTGNPDLDKKFIAEAKEAGIENVNGHRSVGGMRASIYNAMSIEGVKALADFMVDFEKRA